MATTVKTPESRLYEPEHPMTPPRNYKARGYALSDFLLRLLLFASCLAAVLAMVTSKQTLVLPVPAPPFRISRAAKFSDSPAFIYFIAALSVAGFYGLITSLVSCFSLSKSSYGGKVVSHLIIFDVLLLGIVASATGAAGGVAYIGLKGNDKVMWQKICNRYESFCRHVGASIAVSLFASTALALLVIISVRSLSKRIPK